MADLDQNKMDEFAGKMMQIFNSGALNLMISIGHRTGLFDTMANMAPSTSEQIAKQSGLNERYVREWLGAVTTGKIVEHIPENNTYILPKEHAALLTRSASPDNLAVTSQWFSVLGYVEDKIVECFTKGGGVPYSQFNRFHEVMAEESAQTVVSTLVSHILPLVDGLTGLLNNGIKVLDIGCGSGRAMIEMAKQYPKSGFTGFDISSETVARANQEAENAGFSNLSFRVKDVSNIGEDSKFDLITAFDAIHDQAKPDKVLQGIADSLKSDGTFLMQDIAGSSYVHKNMDNPIAPFTYTISCMHCMTVSLAQGGAGLGAAWGEELAVRMLKEAGFSRVDVKQLEHDFINNYYICRK